MKIAHISDLHLQRNLHTYPLISYQKQILDEIIKKLNENEIKHLLIAGDVFDKSIMASRAVELYDYFINQLVENQIKAYVISGNHDSYTKLSLYQDLLKNSGIYIYKAFDNFVEKIDIDESTCLYGIPYLSQLDIYVLEESVKSYNDAYNYVASFIELDNNKTNILMMHGFFTNKGQEVITSDSERLVSVGGLDMVNLNIFESFDYIALGHLHKKQKVANNAYYSGSIAPYSFSELNNVPSINVFDTDTKEVSFIEYPYFYKLIYLENYFSELMKVEVENDCFYKIKVLDKDLIYNLYDKLNYHFNNQVLLLEVKHLISDDVVIETAEEKTVLEELDDFCQKTINTSIIDNEFVKEVLNSVLMESKYDI